MSSLLVYKKTHTGISEMYRFGFLLFAAAVLLSGCGEMRGETRDLDGRYPEYQVGRLWW